MDQIETQKLINEIEEQAREAVHEWAAAKREQREELFCSGCIEQRVQTLAKSVIESALSFAADEHMVEEQLDDVMETCDEADKAYQAEQKAKEWRDQPEAEAEQALVHDPADFLKDDVAYLKELLKANGPDTTIAHYHHATGTKTIIPLPLYLRLATEAQTAALDGAK